MESLSTLKRPKGDSLSLCIICQEHTKVKLVNGGTQGIQKIKERANERHKLKDLKNKDVTERVLNISASQEPPVWYKSCYCWFTDKRKIGRLRSSVPVATPHSSTASCSGTGPSMLRSSKTPLNRKLCLFCQASGKEPFHSVASFNMRDRIIGAKNMIRHFALL